MAKKSARRSAAGDLEQTFTSIALRALDEMAAVECSLQEYRNGLITLRDEVQTALDANRDDLRAAGEDPE